MLKKAYSYIKKKLSLEEDIYKFVILNNEVIPNLLLFALNKFEEAIYIKPHSHPTMSEVFYIKKGKVNFNINDDELIASEGDTVVVK